MVNYYGGYPAYRNNQYGAQTYAGGYDRSGNINPYYSYSGRGWNPPSQNYAAWGRPDLDQRRYNNLRTGDIYGAALQNGWDLNGLGGDLSLGGYGPNGMSGVRTRARRRMWKMGITDYASPFDDSYGRGQAFGKPGRFISMI